jgi:hypothetical protein
MNACAAPPRESVVNSFQLGGRWSLGEVFSEQAQILGISVNLAGFSAGDCSGTVVTGSAGALDRMPTDRAFFELIERACVVDAIASNQHEFEAIDANGRHRDRVRREAVFPEPDSTSTFRYSISNGAAVGLTLKEACEAAYLELIERDRILSSWYGHGVPQSLPLCELIPTPWFRAFQFRFVRFPPSRCETNSEVVGAFAFPKDSTSPFAAGFGAARDIDFALERAARECIQVVGFLWGEPLPSDTPAFDVSPDFHQAMYLVPTHHARIHDWLDGKHALQPNRLNVFRAQGERIFVNLTPPELQGRLWVVKALPDGELPLVFGLGHPNVDACGMTPESRIHPIA